MKLQKVFIIGLVLFTILDPLSVCAQSVEFFDTHLLPDTIRTGKYKNNQSYNLGHVVLYKTIKKAGSFQIADKSTDVELYSFRNNIPDTYLRQPRFFQSYKKNLPTILLVSAEEIYSKGIHVFQIEESTFHYSGFIGFAADNFNFSSLALYAHIELTGDNLILTFDDIDIIDHAREELVKGSDLRFEIQKDSIQKLD